MQPVWHSQRMFLTLCALVMAGRCAGKVAFADDAGNAEIRGPAGKSRIVIRTTNRLAGAIDSLVWNGKQFIDSTDHGRQLQSASNFDVGAAFEPETFNPTEAGSRFDGAGPTSSSRLLRIAARDNVLETTVQMAFWLRPGEKSDGHPARNTTVLSNHLLKKKVTIGVAGLPQVIEYTATFTVPAAERHTFAQFEAVTGYMPAEFSQFLAYDVGRKELVPLSDGPGEQNRPVVLATGDGRFAMGVWSPDQPSPGYEAAGYGRFRFRAEKVVKWNCVFRIRDQAGIKPGDYTFRSLILVGTQQDVEQALRRLTAN